MVTAGVLTNGWGAAEVVLGFGFGDGALVDVRLGGGVVDTFDVALGLGVVVVDGVVVVVVVVVDRVVVLELCVVVVVVVLMDSSGLGSSLVSASVSPKTAPMAPHAQHSKTMNATIPTTIATTLFCDLPRGCEGVLKRAMSDLPITTGRRLHIDHDDNFFGRRHGDRLGANVGGNRARAEKKRNCQCTHSPRHHGLMMSAWSDNLPKPLVDPISATFAGICLCFPDKVMRPGGPGVVKG